jgi:hypothetical protein
MNASIDKDPAGEGEDARGVLASWLDDFSAGKCERADMQESFLSVCRGNPDAPWDALALLDQYQRRGKIDAALVRELKAQIAQLVFGVANQTEASREGEATLDTSGSRWRKLLAERDPNTINNAPAEQDEPEDRDEDEYEEDDDQAVEPPSVRSREPTFGAKPARPAPPAARVAAAESMPRAPVPKAPPRVEQPKVAQPKTDHGRRILRDRYELISIIGRGSMGVVYRALDRHRAHLPEASRRVAVKLFKQDYRDRPDLLADLEQQFHLAQSLSHPNVVSVFDLDRDGDNYFLVMELLEGELLSEVLRRLEGQAMAKEKAFAVINQVGGALLHAHRRNVAHGDVKPRNVMVTTDGEIKVLDFGFVRRQPLERRAVEALQDDLVMAAAAPAYASMERAFGEAPHISDDVYSLACMAYELLSGQHPYGGRSGTFARSHARDPKRISGLTHRQWHALHRALRPARADRKIELEQLLQGLGCLDARPQPYTPHELALRAPESSRFARKLAIATLVFGASIGVVMFVLRQIDAGVWQLPAAPPSPADTTSPEPAQPPLEAPPASGQSSAPSEPAAAPVASEPAEVPGPTSPASTGSPDVTVGFDSDTYVSSESDGSIRLIVKRKGSLRGETSFRWTLKSNSAEAGADFAAIGPNRERMGPGVGSLGLTIPLVSDAIAESTELFQVELSGVEGGAAVGQTSRASVIIVDDD